MKKIFLLIAVLFCFTHVYSQKENLSDTSLWSLELSPFFTTRIGEQKEFVYTKNKSDEYVTLSRLDWQEKPLFFFGLNTKASFKNIFISLCADTALPSDCGKMYDSDWQNVTEVPVTDSLYSLQTDFSNHTNHVNLYFDLSFTLSYKFNFTDLKNHFCKTIKLNSISLEPFAKLDYSFSDFTGRDGSGIYGNTISGETKYAYNDKDNSSNVSYYGKEVIQLERICYTGWTGFTFYAQQSSGFFAELSLAICPYIYLQSLDSHLFSNYSSSRPDSYFLDEMSDFFNGIQISFSLGKSITEHHSFAAKASYTNIAEFDGNTNFSTDKTGFYIQSSSDKAGASFEWFEITLSYIYKF